RILGRETRTLWGKEALKEQLGELQFSISLPSFFQVNSQQTVVLYETIKAMAGLNGSETIVDAFAGAGTIGLWLAKQAKQVYCIESVAEAIADGKVNRALNQIENLEFRQGAVEKLLPELVTQTPADLVILDPPRKGCEPSVLASLIRAEVPKVIYVSCNPATLARDLALLAEYYEIQAIQPIDLFPHTHHLETVVLLTRGGAEVLPVNEHPADESAD
ncbi:MAG: 23S rRNA (uracil(1939)-C(5))-methyltransferase RlmD, partial [Candidatus Sericytochromatia bacterium]